MNKKVEKEWKCSLAFNLKICQITYYGKVLFQGHEEVGLLEAPESLHISWEEKMMHQGFSNIA